MREYHEETGLYLLNPLLKGFVTFVNAGAENNWGVFMFTATDFEGTLAKECREGTLEWRATREIPSLKLRLGDRQFLQYLNKPGFFSGKIIQYKDKVINQGFKIHK